MAKGGMRFNLHGKNDFVARATAFSKNLLTTGAEAAIDAARAGAEEMERVIQISGTGWENKPGRIDSGNMLRDVGYERRASRGMSRSGSASRSATFGWIDGYADYYQYQEEGFVNLRKNRENEGITWGGTPFSGTGGPPGWTAAMGAYAAGYIAARERLRENINNITRKAWYRK